MGIVKRKEQKVDVNCLPKRFLLHAQIASSVSASFLANHIVPAPQPNAQKDARLVRPGVLVPLRPLGSVLDRTCPRQNLIIGPWA